MRAEGGRQAGRRWWRARRGSAQPYAESMRTYEAALSRQDNLAQVKAATRLIERIGGTVQIDPPTATGIVLVVLTLPETYRPEDILPGLPFYPV